MPRNANVVSIEPVRRRVGTAVGLGAIVAVGRLVGTQVTPTSHTGPNVGC